MLTEHQIETAADHYITCAIWAECPEGTTPRATKRTHEIAREIVRRFVTVNNGLVDLLFAQEDYGWHYGRREPECALGHDLWLTTHGHGTGFWDRDLGELGDQLSSVCDSVYHKTGRAWMAEPEFYRGWFYLMPYVSVN